MHLSIDELRKRATQCITAALECREHYLSKLQHSSDAGDRGSKALEPLRQWTMSEIGRDLRGGRVITRRPSKVKIGPDDSSDGEASKAAKST